MVGKWHGPQPFEVKGSPAENHLTIYVGKHRFLQEGLGDWVGVSV